MVSENGKPFETLNSGGVAAKLKRMAAEEDEQKAQLRAILESKGIRDFDEYEREVIVQMAMTDDGKTRDYVKKAFDYLTPTDIGGVAGYVYGILANYWEEHGELPSTRGCKSLVSKEVKQGTWDNEADDDQFYNGVERFLDGVDKLKPADTTMVKAKLGPWITHAAHGRVIERGPDLLAAGDYEGLEKLYADTQLTVGGKQLIRWHEQQDKYLLPNTSLHMNICSTELQQLLNNGGPSPGEVLVYMGRSNVGKSMLLCNDALASSAIGQNTLVITLEMTDRDISERMASIASGVSVERMVPEHEKQVRAAINAQYKRLKRRETLIVAGYSQTSVSVNTIRQLIKELTREGWKPDVVVIDYLELLKPRRPANRTEAVYLQQKAISEDIRWMAQEDRVLVITATQGNRDAAKNEGDVGLHQVAGSYDKIMCVDYVVVINQSKEEYEQGVKTLTGWHPLVRLKIEKNRKGKVGKTVRCAMINGVQLKPEADVAI